MASTEPSMVIFERSTNLSPPSGSLPLDKHVILSWKNGPVKEKSLARKGRPRKGEFSDCPMSLDFYIETALQVQALKNTMECCTSPPPAYEFVAWTSASGNTNAAARKAVRSHTMRYRIMKLDQDRPRFPFTEKITIRSEIRGDTFTEQNMICSKVHGDAFKDFLGIMPPEVLTLDPFDSLPVRIKPYMIDLFAKCKHYCTLPVILEYD